jgi:hypothetical protein
MKRFFTESRYFCKVFSECAIVQVDAFTSTRFGGNPAAVCILEHSLDDGILQLIAAEMNLSETAYVQPLPEKGSAREVSLVCAWSLIQRQSHTSEVHLFCKGH